MKRLLKHWLKRVSAEALKMKKIDREAPWDYLFADFTLASKIFPRTMTQVIVSKNLFT